MKQEAVGEAVEARRLDPALLEVELDEGDALEQLPRDGLWEEGPDVRMILAHDEPHLGRALPAAGAAHALEERAHREGGVDLKGALETSDINPQFEGCRGDRGHALRLVAHEILRGLANRAREVAMVDQEAIRLVRELAVTTEFRAVGFRVLTGVGEEQTFLVA